jgi:small conductance mechanosensitive channel
MAAPTPTPVLPGVLPENLDTLRSVRINQQMIAKAVDLLGDFSVKLVVAVLILAVTFWGAGWISRGVRAALGRIHQDSPDTTLQSFGSSLARYLVIIVGMVAVLQQLGVQTTSVLAVLGAAGLAVGLALQGALSNVAAGVMILLFRPYRIGDLIETSTRKGTVRSLDLFFTEMATPDNMRIIIPNSKVMADVVINYTTNPRRRVEAVIKLPYAADINAVIAGLKARIADDPRGRKDPPPTVEVTDMAHDHFEVTARVWTTKDDEPVIKAELLLVARLLAGDPKAQLPPYGPTRARSKTVEPPAHGLALLRRGRGEEV